MKHTLQDPKGALKSSGKAAWLFLLAFSALLTILFFRAALPGKVLFSNDGPLGAASAEFIQTPASFLGIWQDLNTVGSAANGYPLGLSGVLFWVLGPLVFSKVYAALTLLYLGIAAWFLFRSLNLAPWACALGGMAAALNSGFFAASCWGVGAHSICAGSMYIAVGLLAGNGAWRSWLKTFLAGLMVGLGVVEGADIGAIFSVYVAAFVLFSAWVRKGASVRTVAFGISKAAVVALFAGFFAAHSISGLVRTQIQGVAGAQQDTRTKEERWDWATQWSLPKREALGLIVPGLFGYRMDTPDGGNYWGAMGRDVAWDQYFASGKQGPAPRGFIRYGGAAPYPGILVLLIAAWAVAQSFRKDSVFSPANRRQLWFWTAVVAISLPLAFGRYASFYRLLYALPYFSTIRNPTKFLYPMNWAIVVLFAYGVHGLWKRYLESPETALGGVAGTVKAWWARVRGFDRRWTLGLIGWLALSALGWLVYASSKASLTSYLEEVNFDSSMSGQIADYSVRQAGIYLLFLAAAAGLLVLVISGCFRGARARWGAGLLGLFLVLDLGRANQPFIVVWDYQQKYATNPVVDFLREQPYEHRVAILPEWLTGALKLPPQFGLLDQLYRIEWAQHLFLYYNIQSLDIVQMSRMPEDLAAFETALQPRDLADIPRLLPRKWELTNTRYLLGPADLLDFLNRQMDPGRSRFRIAERFQLVNKSGVATPTKLEELTAVPATNGMFAVFEFTGALPRARLYTHWQGATNGSGELETLTSGEFHPDQTVLVEGAMPFPPASGATNAAPGTVEFVSYAPKRIVLKVEARSNAVLLLNDRWAADWKVFVDGRPERLLRANYLMRGVALSAGAHQVEFRFEPPIQTFYVSLAACGAGVLLCGALLITRRQEGESDATKT